MTIEKSEGVSPTEKLLADLCERSFLKLWSYPNPFKEDRKELCDLLAVFGSHVFIFFDREKRQFENPDQDPDVAWKRWKRRVIDDQVATAHGAERYIRSGRDIFLDNGLKTPFPLKINRDNLTVHKIIVAHGAQEACKQASDENVYGSLGVFYANKRDFDDYRFVIDIDRENPVHVFDSVNLPIIFAELDTFYDLSQYLDTKLEAIGSVASLSYCGEEDLLANYFLNFDEKEKKHFIGMPRNTEETRQHFDGIHIGEGDWQNFIKRPEYKNKKSADKVSYLWDQIIQKTANNALTGTLEGASPLDGRSAIHEMAMEPRFIRRALSRHMIEAVENFPDGDGMMRNLSFMPSFYEGKGYVFLQTKGVTDRNIRRQLLEIGCGATRNQFQHLKTIVGIGVEAPKYSSTIGEDFILMDCQNWPEDRRKDYEEANTVVGFYQSETLTAKRQSVRNFPSSNES